jgi:crotonobetainyl-CoA:carnitine CoA-transferase CaiB-like acyl-CoA transferase
MQPLKGLRILDFSMNIAGPFCSLFLGDMGADVIKIEMPLKGNLARSYGPFGENLMGLEFLQFNRSKKSVTLNLKTPEAKDIIYKLVQNVDVLLENFRPGVMDRLGLSYEKIKEINPRIVYCSVSGFGQSGPYRERGAYDIVILGMSGMMTPLHEEPNSKPVEPPLGMADLTGGLWATIGILLALWTRNITGNGQYVDVSMLDALLTWKTYQIGLQSIGDKSPMFGGPYGIFKAKDAFFTLAVTDDTTWRKLCQALELTNLTDDPRFSTFRSRGEVKNHEELVKILNDHFSALKSDQIINKLLEYGIVCGPINTIEKILSDPQIKFREMIVDVDHPRVGKIKASGIPIKLSETPGKITYPTPILGQNTREILKEIGYNDIEIKLLRKKGVI